MNNLLMRPILATILWFAGFLLAANADTLTLTPTSSGSIRQFPEFGVFERAPVGDDIQSTYFRTTSENREYRRGFFEFEFPTLTGPVTSAVLKLTETRGFSSAPTPARVHEISYYAADRMVDISDFDRPTIFLTRFETDENLPPEVFSFDVTSLVERGAGSTIGFRVSLQSDTAIGDYGAFGSSFGSVFSSSPRIEITTIPEPSTGWLTLLGLIGFFLLVSR